jgi:hypothetical protein
MNEIQAAMEQAQNFAPDTQPATNPFTGECKPLMREMPDASIFPLDALGDILGPAARKVSEIVQIPEALTGNSFLAAAALAVQGYANILIDGRSVSLNEFFATIAESGDRKSEADRIALAPVRQHQKDLAGRQKDELQQYENSLAAFDRARQNALKSKGNREQIADALNKIGAAPESPITPTKVIKDTTFEGLCKNLAIGQPSVGVYNPEGGQILGGHAMNSDNQLKTATGLSCLWDGDAIDRVRAGDGASILYGRRVSMHLMIQPNLAPLLFGNAMLAGQGLLSRILVTYPSSIAGTRQYREVDIYQSPEIQRYQQALAAILSTPEPLAEGTKNELNPRQIRLNPKAKSLWISFYNATEQALGAGGPLEHIRGLAAKMPEHALRLAGILELTSNLQCAEVSYDSVAAGIELANHYLNEALRLFHAGAMDPKLVLAQKLLDWLRLRNQPEITLVEIYRLGPNAVREAKTARSVMETLVDHGWAAVITGGKAFEDTVRKEAYRIRL